MNFSEFLNGYIDALLWASTDGNGEPLDNGEYELAPEALEKCRADCVAFMYANKDDLALFVDEYEPAAGYTASECAGHDFWLTRNGHGAGFWGRGLGELGARLTALSKSFSGCDAYIGDDGRVYLS